MLTVISPAKTLDFDTPGHEKIFSEPDMLDQSQQLINELRKLAPHEISQLMKISDKLGLLNYERFQQWQRPFDQGNAKQAVLAFKGDVYTGLEAETFKTNDLKFAQKHLRILSGLYGLLRPMDLIQPYRLEMGTRFANTQGKDLYTFWGSLITDSINTCLKETKSKTLVNLASQEYFKSVQEKKVNAEIITPVFKDFKNGQYKIISFFAKKARGMMSAYIIRNRITEKDGLKAFDTDGYKFNKAMSSNDQYVFTRKLTD